MTSTKPASIESSQLQSLYTLCDEINKVTPSQKRVSGVARLQIGSTSETAEMYKAEWEIRYNGSPSNLKHVKIRTKKPMWLIRLWDFFVRPHKATEKDISEIFTQVSLGINTEKKRIETKIEQERSAQGNKKEAIQKEIRKLDSKVHKLERLSETLEIIRGIAAARIPTKAPLQPYPKAPPKRHITLSETITVFTSPRTTPINPSEFELHLQNILIGQYQGSVSEEVLQSCRKEGELQLERLARDNRYFQASVVAEKLVQIGVRTAPVKRFLLGSLMATGNREKIILYARKFLSEPLPSDDPEKKETIEYNQKLALSALDYCLGCKLFEDAVWFGKNLLEIVPEDRKEFVRQKIAETQVASKHYSDINDVQKGVSKIPGVSQRQFELINLLANRYVVLNETQKEELRMFLACCIGNKELSKSLSSWKPSDSQLGGVTKELSILSYKTQPENIEKYMKAVEKLSTILKKITLRQDVIASQRLAQALEELPQSHGALPIFHTVQAPYKDEEEAVRATQEEFVHKAAAAQQKIAQAAKGQEREAVIFESDKLTASDLTALNSIINLKNTLISYPLNDFLAGNQQVEEIIRQGTRAEELISILIPLLGSGYQTGDLSFRNNHKFETLTGKSTGLMERAYHFLTRSPFGHGALIDQALEEGAVEYSEVLGEATHRAVPVEDFFTTDVYRLKTSSLLSEEGTRLASARLEMLKKDGLLNPLTTLDQYLQETFIGHMDDILSGTEEMPIAEVEQEPPPLTRQEIVTKAEELRTAEDLLRRTKEGLSKEHRKALQTAEKNLQEATTALDNAKEHNLRLAPRQQRLTIAQQELEEIKKTVGVYALEKNVMRLTGVLSVTMKAIRRQLEIEEKRSQSITLHRKGFEGIRNDGSLQINAGIGDLLIRPFSILRRKRPKQGDFKEIRFEGRMICSQFQALAILKALALTQDSMYAMMAEQRISEGKPSKAEEVPTSKAPTEVLVVSEPKPKTAEEQKAYDAALAQVKRENLFKIPVSESEERSWLVPRRVARLFRSYLSPVPMAPVAREILALPEQYFGTALFG